MTVTANLYANAIAAFAAAAVNWSADTINAALMAPTYTPDLDTDTLWSDISANEASGSGYTAGGTTVTTTLTLTAANSWTVPWSATTGFAAGKVIIPTSPNGYLYKAAVGGTTGSSQPTWPTVVGKTVTDGGVTWTCVGQSITVFTSGAPLWSPLTTSAASMVIYDVTSGALLDLVQFGATESPSAEPFTVLPLSPEGWFNFTPS